MADLLIQRETESWHCAARREIAERSEEAPGAKAAQPSRNAGRWKTPGGCFGGDARGAEKGAQPHNRPRLAPAGGGPNSIKRKAPVPAGHRSHLSKDKPGFTLLKSQQCYINPALPPPEAAQNDIKEKPPCPQGTEASSQRTSPALFITKQY